MAQVMEPVGGQRGQGKEALLLDATPTSPDKGHMSLRHLVFLYVRFFTFSVSVAESFLSLS